MSPSRIAALALVLVVLAAVGLASISRRGEEAKRAGSARNLQQWGISLNLYLMDNNNQLPGIGGTPITPDQKDAWYNALPPYLSKPALAELPEGQRPRPGVPSMWIDPTTKPVRVWDPAVFYFNYAMNRALQPETGVRSFRIYEISHPGNVVFLTEVDGYSPWASPDDVVFRHGGAKPSSPRATAHVLFSDGHVQSVQRAVLVDDPASRLAKSAAEGISWAEK